ncbi:hypothetical protein EJ08DRAFT_314213 [Tothia fuscella]|uniref:Leo1-like protein n=1 Tax=Tothia fuscella TaxID=1048955 RepID=A0A9P4NPD3_9PEZI|nr:hypothetical protein EJ08DRAFT_314213 [Tothia fuscella]
MSSDEDLPEVSDLVNDKAPAQNSDEDLDDAGLKDDMEDLFGDEVDEEAEKMAQRQLDDSELDSGDDEGRVDRARQDEEPEQPETEDFNIQDIDMPRHPVPEPGDGETYVLKVPRFLGVDATAFTLQSFQPPTTDHHSLEPPSASFSAFKTAQTTIRWRHSPSDPDELQSNARFLRWADGSVTLQLASDPTIQYDITPKTLAPPQRNPKKPTPTSIHDKGGRTTTYNEKADSFTYLASASQEAFMVRITNKLTTSLVVVPSTAGTDEALERLQTSMAALTGNAGGTQRVTIERITEDPELAKKKAEQAEKEKLRAQRRLEAQQTRERDRTSRVFARGPRGAGGLTVGDLEDGDGGGGARRAPRPKQRRSRQEQYTDSEEEYGGRGRNAKEDHYDREDDFLADSDEDDDRDAEGEDDEDIDAVIESREREQREKQRERVGTPKRDRAPVAVEDDEPAGAAGSPVRTKRRRVIADDDEDE